MSEVSLEVRATGSNQTLLSLNSDKARNPASAIKILTTLSALEILGPHHQWHTRYFLDGNLKGNVLEGNLILQGGGDPFLTVERFWHQLLQLRQTGIHSITGNLIIDNSMYAIAKQDRSAFDNKPARPYNVDPDAALVNFSATRFVIQPDKERIVVLADPPLVDMVILNRIKPKKGDCIDKDKGWTYNIENASGEIRVFFDGHYHASCGQHSIFLLLLSNDEYTFRLFKSLWLLTGGVFNGSYQTGKYPASIPYLASYPSVPLADIITSINKFSNNVMSKMLLLNLDAQLENKPATIHGARKIVADWLVSIGLALPELILDNGSGLSRETRITVAGLVDLLQHGWQSIYQPEFFSSLPLLALDGTMRKRLKDNGMQGRGRIKTGYIKGIRSMAGYVTSRNGTQYSVAMVIESGKVDFRNGNQIQDALLKWLYEQPH